MSMNTNHNLIRFFQSFKYAFKGLIYCVKNERNMRFHLCAAFYVLTFMRAYDLTSAQRALVYAVVGIVISLEAVNTAIERLVDIASPERNKAAGIAKDCAAGAVLASAIAAAVIGFEFFWDIDTFRRIGEYFSSHIVMLVLSILSVIIWLIIIFVPNSKRKEK